jgi:hypothetical protein
MDKRRKKKAIVLSLGLAAMMLPVMASAQGGGVFQLGTKPETEGNSGLMGRAGVTAEGDITGQGFGATNGDITGQTFGDDAPLGSGLFVLLAAGAGYATMKSRKKQSKQNRKEK